MVEDFGMGPMSREAPNFPLLSIQPQLAERGILVLCFNLFWMKDPTPHSPYPCNPYTWKGNSSSVPRLPSVRRPDVLVPGDAGSRQSHVASELEHPRLLLLRTRKDLSILRNHQRRMIMKQASHRLRPGFHQIPPSLSDRPHQLEVPVMVLAEVDFVHTLEAAPRG